MKFIKDKNISICNLIFDAVLKILKYIYLKINNMVLKNRFKI